MFLKWLLLAHNLSSCSFWQPLFLQKSYQSWQSLFVVEVSSDRGRQKERGREGTSEREREFRDFESKGRE